MMKSKCPYCDFTNKNNEFEGKNLCNGDRSTMGGGECKSFMTINEEGILNADVYIDGNHEEYQSCFSAPLKYCPMCGRYLGGEKI